MASKCSRPLLLKPYEAVVTGEGGQLTTAANLSKNFTCPCPWFQSVSLSVILNYTYPYFCPCFFNWGCCLEDTDGEGEIDFYGILKHCWKFCPPSSVSVKERSEQSWGFTSRSTARVILGQVLRIATCGTRTHRGDSLWLDAKLANH